MRVLFLCSRVHCNQKMSRGRFLYMEAIGKLCPLDTWGNDHPDYDKTISVSKNLAKRPFKYDVVIAYKPENHIEFSEVDAIRVTDINEMFDVKKMTENFEKMRFHLAICHHANEMMRYVDLFPETRFVHVPHCSDPNIFHDYGGKKNLDVLVIGRLSSKHYPLRTRMATEVVPALVKMGFKAEVWTHPGYNIENANNNAKAVAYAKRIAESRIALFCSGVTKTRFAKYNEAVFCGTAIMADIPDEDQDFFREFVIEVTVDMPTDKIVAKVIASLQDPIALQKRSRLGREKCRHLTTEFYAKRAVEEFKRLMS